MRRLFNRIRAGSDRSRHTPPTQQPQPQILPIRENAASAPAPVATRHIQSSVATIHDAASQGLTEAVIVFLDRGVPVDFPDVNNNNATALHLAIRNGHVQTVRLLLAWGASVEVPHGPLATRALHLAAMTMNPAIMEAVLDQRPDLESRCNGITALFYAASLGDEQGVKLLLDAGADIHSRTTCKPGTGESILHMACGSFANDVVALLIRRGANVNVTGTYPMGQTAMHIAAQYNNAEAISMLIDAGSNMYAQFPQSKLTALEVAAENGSIRAVKVLTDHGMDPLRNFSGNQNAVFMAAIHGKKDMCRWFIDQYGDRMSRSTKIQFAIGAAGANRIEILKMLHARGFPITGYDEKGMGALFAALHFNHEDAIVYLLQCGADYEPHIPRDPNSWVLKDESQKAGIEMLRNAERQRQASPDAKLFPDWKFKDTETDTVAFQTEAMAVMASLNATRRVHVNQEPPGAFACYKCHDLDFRRGMQPEDEVVYFISLKTLKENAAVCNGCRFLTDCLEAVRRGYGETVWAAMSGQYLALYSQAKGAPLLAHFHNGNPGLTPSRRIEIFIKRGGGPAWPVVGSARDVSLQDWNQERVNIARDFLWECTTNHPNCHYTPGKLPTRVIRIPPNREPYLHISKGEKAKYMTLSHCWGNVSPLTTTKATLSQHAQQIPLATLPKTFRDAVAICRSVGVEFLWIDSLCIIQDDGDDWSREAAQMKAVYANCYAMISADGSANPHGGCFGAGVNPKTCSFEVQSAGRMFSKVTAYVRLTQLRDTFHTEVGHKIGDAKHMVMAVSAADNQSRTVLNERGWCFQERVLAPRILHFGSSELAWECPETVACECQCVLTAHDKESRFKSMFADRLLREQNRMDSQPSLAASPTTPQDEVQILLWMHFVEEFSRRQLTYARDSLHALSGLAEFMNGTARTDYLCGLWKSNLAEFLLWQVDVPHHVFDNPTMPMLAPRPFRTRPSAGGNEPWPASLMVKTHADYYAPSWSWASMIAAPIKFHIGRLDTRAEDQISHVRKDGRLEETKARPSLLHLIEANIYADPLNRFGPPKGPASLTMRGPTVSAIWTGASDADAAIKQQMGDQVLRLPFDGPESCQDQQWKAHFTPDPLREDILGIRVGDELLLLV